MNREEIVKNDDNKNLIKCVNELSYICGVSIYYDKTASIRRDSEFCRNKWENNYAIVTKDGRFLQDLNFMRRERFYHQISLNEYGLFKLTHNYYDKGFENEVYQTNCIVDYKANFLDNVSFNLLITILTNRNKSYSPPDFIEMIPDLKKGIFSISVPNSSGWITKDGNYHLKYDEETEDGLLFYSEEYSRTYSDSTYSISYVKDKCNNSMELDEFYRGMLMLKNGAEYMAEMRDLYVKSQIEINLP